MSQSISRRLVAAVAAALLVAPIPGAFAQQGEFRGDATVVVVEVPVHVTRDGEPVRGLTAENFEVREGRRRLPVVGFEVFDLEALAVRGPAATPVPAAARRNFLLLFDLVFSDLKAVNRSREAAVDFVRQQLRPTDTAAVALYSSRGAQLLLGFTSDRRQVELAVNSLGTPQLIERTPDPLALSLGREAGGLSQPDSATQAGGGAANEAVKEMIAEHLESLVREEAANARREQETRVVAMSRSYADLARLVGGLEGRKYVMLFSEGFPSSMLSGSGSLSAEPGDNLARERGEVWTMETSVDSGSTRIQNVVDGMLEEFRRADAVIQAIDAGGLRDPGDRGGSFGLGKDSLLMMARDTGGQLYENFNDLGAATERMNRATSVTYLLTVQPQDLRHDGKFHEIEVELVGVPRAEVSHRAGFYAPDPSQPPSLAARQLEAAEAIVSGEEGGELSAGVIAAAFPQPNGTAYVPVLVEVDGAGLLAGNEQAVLELYAYALRPDGTVAAHFNQNLGLDPSKVGDKVRASGVKYWGHVMLPPGDYSLRVLARNTQTGRSALRVTPVSVPLAGADPVLAAPLFPEPQDAWLLIPEARRPDVDFPFMMGEAPFIPAARPKLPRQGTTTLQLVGYNLPQGRLVGTARLVGADGAAVPGATLRLGGRQDAPNGGPSRVAAELETSGLAPGAYTLVVTLGAEGGGAETTALPVVVSG